MSAKHRSNGLCGVVVVGVVPVGVVGVVPVGVVGVVSVGGGLRRGRAAPAGGGPERRVGRDGRIRGVLQRSFGRAAEQGAQ
jgi:hypothetical protein